jgi:hypothetical protein
VNSAKAQRPNRLVARILAHLEQSAAPAAGITSAHPVRGCAGLWMQREKPADQPTLARRIRMSTRADRRLQAGHRPAA